MLVPKWLEPKMAMGNEGMYVSNNNMTKEKHTRTMNIFVMLINDPTKLKMQTEEPRNTKQRMGKNTGTKIHPLQNRR